MRHRPIGPATRPDTRIQTKVEALRQSRLSGRFSLKRILLGGLLVSLSLTGLFAWMSYWRLAAMSEQDLVLCSGVNALQMADCLNVALYNHLWNGQWIAAQFSLYVSLAALFTYLTCRRAPSAPMFHALMIAVISAIALLNLIEPGRLSALSAFLGACLGGLVAQRRLMKTWVRVNPS